MSRKNRGQSILEFAMGFAVVIAALLAMRMYIVRGIKGRYYDTLHGMGEHYVAGKTTYKYTTAQEGDLKTQELFGLDNLGNPKSGVSTYTVLQPATFSRCATGADKETINVTFDAENLFDK